MRVTSTLVIVIASLAISALLLVGCEQVSETPAGESKAGDAAKGKQLFAATCSTCHGADAEGVKGLGKGLKANAFIKKASDEDLVKVITEGRAPKDPLNTTGILMPPKGGNPGLSDADLRDVVAFLRTLQ